MHYSTAALVLAISTVSSVVATPHGHQHLHKKHTDLTEKRTEDQTKRTDYSNVDWSAVDWSAVDWSTVSYTYSSGQTWGTSTSAAPVAAATSTTVAAAAAATTEAASSAVAAVAAAAETTSVAASSAVASAAASASASSSSSSDSDSILSDLISAAEEVLSALGALAGTNAVSDNGEAWIGTDGAYTTEIINSAGEDLTVVAWGTDGSWINAVAPLISYTIAAGDSLTISFAENHSGALSAICSGTELVNGQVSQTWMEYTWNNYGVFDISREVNMNGRSFSAVGPECVSDMDTCVFKCTSGDSCEYDYELVNCETGSQSGAQYGTYDGAASGGCGGLGTSANVKLTIS